MHGTKLKTVIIPNICPKCMFPGLTYNCLLSSIIVWIEAPQVVPGKFEKEKKRKKDILFSLTETKHALFSSSFESTI